MFVFQETYDLEGAATYLKVHPSTMQELASSGAIPGAKNGRAWCFHIDDLRTYLREQIVTQTTERLSRSNFGAVLRGLTITSPSTTAQLSLPNPSGKTTGRGRQSKPLPSLAIKHRTS